MSLWVSMNTAVSGLNAAQNAINLASRNVANANTDGYTAKTITFSSLTYGGVSEGVINRKVSQALFDQSREEGNKLANYTVQSRFLSSVANYLGTPATGAGTDGGRMNIKLQDLNDMIQNLGTTPTLSTSQVLTKNAAEALAQELRDTSKYIQEQRRQADYEIGQAIKDINSILGNIDKLNKDISRSMAMGQDAAVADLMDHRDTEISKLSEYFAVKTYDGAAPGSVVVMMENGPIMVDAQVRYFDEYSSAGTVSAGMFWSTQGSAFDKIAFTNSPDVDLTSQLKNGALGALIQMRDGTLPQLQAEVDTMTVMLRDRINEAHNLGVSLPPQGTLTGSHAFGANTAGTSVTLSGAVDIRLVDANGDSVLGGTIPAGTYTLDALQTAIDAAIPGGTATFDVDGHLIITPPVGSAVAFVEDPAAVGTVTNNSNGDVVNGLSNFFGLNDFYQSRTAEGRTYQTASTKNLNHVLTNVQFTFRDANDTVGGGVGTTLGPFNGNLQQIVDQINAGLPAGSDITASVYRDGDSYAIRFEGSSTMTVAQAAGSTMTVSRYEMGASEQLYLNDRLSEDPSQINKGQLFDDGSGNWTLNSGDGTIATKMADVFTATYPFPSTSGMGGTMTIKTYLAQTVGDISSRSSTALQSMQDQAVIASSVNEKLATYSGVDLDQELTGLIVLQNAYGASARVISSINTMLDTLFEIVR